MVLNWDGVERRGGSWGWSLVFGDGEGKGGSLPGVGECGIERGEDILVVVCIGKGGRGVCVYVDAWLLCYRMRGALMGGGVELEMG